MPRPPIPTEAKINAASLKITQCSCNNCPTHSVLTPSPAEHEWMFRQDIIDIKRTVHRWLLLVLLVSMVLSGVIAPLRDWLGPMLGLVVGIILSAIWGALVTMLGTSWAEQMIRRPTGRNAAQMLPGTRARRKMKQDARRNAAHQHAVDMNAAEQEQAEMIEASFEASFTRATDAYELERASLDRQLQAKLTKQREEERAAQVQEIQRLLRPGARLKDGS